MYMRNLQEKVIKAFCFKNWSDLSLFRECVSTGAAGARTRRSLRHHLLHPLILRLLIPVDFESQSSLLYKGLQPQIQIPNACPDIFISLPELVGMGRQKSSFLLIYHSSCGYSPLACLPSCRAYVRIELWYKRASLVP